MEEIQSVDQSARPLANHWKATNGANRDRKLKVFGESERNNIGRLAEELIANRFNRGEGKYLLKELLREEQKSWNDSKTVIVNIDNSRKLNNNSEAETNSSKLAQTKQTRITSNRAKDSQEKGKESSGSYRKLGENLQQEEKEEVDKKKEVPQERRNSLPTFGGAPLKLANRLPYFSYFGKARNVDLVNAADRKVQQVNPQVSGSSTHSSSGSTSSTNELFPVIRTSKIPVPEGKKLNVLSKEKTQRGYSNISNLFPGRPSMSGRDWLSARISPPQKAQSSGNLLAAKQQQPITRVAGVGAQYSNSNSNLNSDSQRVHNVDRRYAQQVLAQRNRQQGQQGRYGANRSPISHSPTNMRRQNSANLLTNTKVKGGSYTTGGYHQTGRPASTLGYGNTLNRSRRVSPMQGGSHYNLNGPLSPQYSNFGIPIDPDCPVHGDYATPYSAGLSRSVQHLSDPHRDLGLDDDGGDDGLLYADMQPSAGYYDSRQSPYGNPQYPNSGSLYSPTSPLGMSRSGSGALNHQGGNKSSSAYYNNSTRFGLYHSPSVASATGGRRSSLAPPNEQLRRILGYQPPPAKARPVHLHPQWAYSRPFIHLQGARSPSPILDADGELDLEATYRPPYVPYNQLLDTQAVRAVDFHPTGEVYAIGSNSRTLRICAYPADHELRHFSGEHIASSPRVLFKYLQVHRGSIYCVSFNSSGQLLATGSNDQTIHLVKYNSTTHSADGEEYRLTMHDGTIRDLCFIDDPMNGSALLLSAGGGDNKIYVTDCDTITPFQSMAGHTQTVMALHHWSGANFVSASYDKTIRLWDLRTRACTSIISAPPTTIAGKWAGPGAPVCAVKVDPTGRLMASGHSDSSCMLYDMRAGRIIQTFKPHDDELRTVSFSPKSYYLLTGGYDGRLVLTDLQGDLSQPLPSVCVAECSDKIVQSKWHPSDFTFVTTCADKTATLWALPTE